MNGQYVLDGKVPRPEPDLIRWAKSLESHRVVARTNDVTTGADVSTVFLGLDHSFGGGVPILFETMVFGGPLDGAQERYATWDEAEKGHAAMVARCRGESIEAAAMRLGRDE